MRIHLTFGFFCVILFTLLIELRALPQITKLIPLEDWIAFKNRTSNINPLDKFLGKLRATYDFVFHKPDNITNVKKILMENKSEPIIDNTEKIIMSTLSIIGDIIYNNNQRKTSNDSVYLELLPEENIIPTKVSSISRISKDNKWLDEIEVQEPLSEEEAIDDEDIDRSVEIVTPKPGFQLSAAVAQAFGKWLASILRFTREAYSKLMHLSVRDQ
ncbi:uncharacterized protein [Chelonus insularis]|uniref:uncharacterized protein n=1 Tax=Chelonus insularis TaxID=460826 RepID=UPI0015893425|nr:uncharacterized protein LOC118066301 [Chelonus insularis]